MGWGGQPQQLWLKMIPRHADHFDHTRPGPSSTILQTGAAGPAYASLHLSHVPSSTMPPRWYSS